MTAPDPFSEDLERAASGDQEARNRLWAQHYELLRDCAKAWYAKRWQRPGDELAISLGGSDIVSLAYQRLHDRTAALTKGRAWFFRCFYTECLRIAVDHYRKTKNERGRGKVARVDSGTAAQQALHQEVAQPLADPDIIHDLLDELEKAMPRAAMIAKLKIFERKPSEDTASSSRGLTNAEVAEIMDCSLRTAEKDWAYAKAFLVDELNPQPEDS